VRGYRNIGCNIIGWEKNVKGKMRGDEKLHNCGMVSIKK